MVPTLMIMVSMVLSQMREGPNFAFDGEGCRRSTCQVDPIERLVPDANTIQQNMQTSNILFQASYPETVWKSDADGRLERFNLWTFRQGLTKLAKLNRDVFTLTHGVGRLLLKL